MIKKLRAKFVLVFMVTVSALLLTILCLICNTTRKEMRAASLAALQSAVFDPDRHLEKEDASQKLPEKESERHDSPEKKPELDKKGPVGTSPCFVLWLTPQGTLGAQGSDVYDLSDAQMLTDILSEAHAEQRQTGVLYQWHLRYYRMDRGPEVCYAFLDISGEMKTMNTLVFACILIGCGALAAFFLVAVLLSRWLVRPVEQAFDAQRQFVADASHELKTPLTVILTNAEMLQSEDYDGSTKQRFASSIYAMSTQMRGLVESLLELARVDNSAAPKQMQTVLLSELAEECVLPFEPVYFEAGRVLASRIAPGIRVQGAQSQLHQVLDVLLDNGQKYSDPGSTVLLKLSMQGSNHCLLTVASQGVPLTAQQCKEIFKRFYRVDGTRSMNRSYGLGLPIAEGIIARHKGKIWCQSKDGVNTFYVSLPTCNPKH